MPDGDMFAVFALFDSLTGGEVFLVLLLALMVLGPERLPEAARTLGVWISKLKSMSSNLQSEVREVLDDPAMQPIREVGEFMAAPRKKLVEYATAAEAEAAAEAAAVGAAIAEGAPDPVADGEADTDRDTDAVADNNAVADTNADTNADTDPTSDTGSGAETDGDAVPPDHLTAHDRAAAYGFYEAL